MTAAGSARQEAIPPASGTAPVAMLTAASVTAASAAPAMLTTARTKVATSRKAIAKAVTSGVWSLHQCS